MSTHRMEGLAIVSLAVPFTIVLDDEEAPIGGDLTEWMNGSFDRLEGIEMPTPA